MSKVNIKVGITNEKEQLILNTKGILVEEILKYNEENGIKVRWDYNKNILTRENDEWKMTYPFALNKKTQGIIEMKQMDRKINLELTTKKLERKNHDIKISYFIEEQEYLYQIEEIK